MSFYSHYLNRFPIKLILLWQFHWYTFKTTTFSPLKSKCINSNPSTVMTSESSSVSYGSSLCWRSWISTTTYFFCSLCILIHYHYIFIFNLLIHKCLLSTKLADRTRHFTVKMTSWNPKCLLTFPSCVNKAMCVCISVYVKWKAVSFKWD